MSSAAKHVHERGCPWDEFKCMWAADVGHLEYLTFAHERGCPWDELTPAIAARTGSLTCLAYAHEHGCPWDDWTPHWAAMCGRTDCMQYAYERGCPGSRDTSGGRREAASKTIGRACLRWKTVRETDVRLVLSGRLPAGCVALSCKNA